MSLTDGMAGKVLVAPLDWGLGHATRCIPVVQALLAQGCQVILAAEGAQAAVLQEAFPQLQLLPLPGYGIVYSRSQVLLKVLRQLPRIAAAISAEHCWLQNIVEQHAIEAVVSDNRYGMWSPRCYNVLITHQLQPALPAKWQWAQGLARRLFYQKIERFHEVWVPDVAQPEAGLSGIMGHPSVLPRVPVHYIGWLSRFAPALAALPSYKYQLLVVLSGPEPQRSMLEEKLLQQLPQLQQPVLLVRGLPLQPSLPKVPPMVTVVNHLPAAELQAAMLQSQFLLSRGGYSTLMDAFTLGLRCLFVPTPGQTEQEYLCQRLWQQRLAYTVSQQHFHLGNHLAAASRFGFRQPMVPPGNLHNFVGQWLKRW